MGGGGVSIPFKREGVSKGVVGRSHSAKNFFEFQFPSNGKVYPKAGRDFYSVEEDYWFQFPSNGKVYPKAQSHLRWDNDNSFNSLQTGRCIQSDGKINEWTIKVGRFNSLQTGRCIQSKTRDELREPLVAFQFPSNGKVYHK